MRLGESQPEEIHIWNEKYGVGEYSRLENIRDAPMADGFSVEIKMWPKCSSGFVRHLLGSDE